LKVEPPLYREMNNSSWFNEQEFGIKAVLKLFESGRVVEVEKKELQCVNPLS
jgi:hypothetical protein